MQILDGIDSLPPDELLESMKSAEKSYHIKRAEVDIPIPFGNSPEPIRNSDKLQEEIVSVEVDSCSSYIESSQGDLVHSTIPQLDKVQTPNLESGNFLTDSILKGTEMDSYSNLFEAPPFETFDMPPKALFSTTFDGNDDRTAVSGNPPDPESPPSATRTKLIADICKQSGEGDQHCEVTIGAERLFYLEDTDPTGDKELAGSTLSPPVRPVEQAQGEPNLTDPDSDPLRLSRWPPHFWTRCSPINVPFPQVIARNWASESVMGRGEGGAAGGRAGGPCVLYLAKDSLRLTHNLSLQAASFLSVQLKVPLIVLVTAINFLIFEDIGNVLLLNSLFVLTRSGVHGR